MKILSLVLACCVLQLSICKAQSGYQQEITQYAEKLYSSFTNLQTRSGRLSFSDTTRLKWNNLPVGLRPRVGASIGSMSNDQRRLVHRMLSASLSSQGYLKATGIMHLDDLLNNMVDTMLLNKAIDDKLFATLKGLQWGHANYYFAFFGQPGDETWGYKLEGHHLSVNFTFSPNHISVTPLFVGTDPAEISETQHAGWRVLGQEEDLALALINQLPPALRNRVTQKTEVPQDIFTSAESGRRLVDNWGIKVGEMPPAQKQLAERLIREFVFNMEYDKAQAEFKKINDAGLDNVYFGWIGAYVENIPHYFVLNGPTFLIEYDNRGRVGASGPEANHIHAIWREKGNEFGEDVLKKHYEAHKH